MRSGEIELGLRLIPPALFADSYPKLYSLSSTGPSRRIFAQGPEPLRDGQPDGIDGIELRLWRTGVNTRSWRSEDPSGLESSETRAAPTTRTAGRAPIRPHLQIGSQVAWSSFGV